jgi:hypothetical protein
MKFQLIDKINKEMTQTKNIRNLVQTDTVYSSEKLLTNLPSSKDGWSMLFSFKPQNVIDRTYLTLYGKDMKLLATIRSENRDIWFNSRDIGDRKNIIPIKMDVWYNFVVSYNNATKSLSISTYLSPTNIDVYKMLNQSGGGSLLSQTGGNIRDVKIQDGGAMSENRNHIIIDNIDFRNSSPNKIVIPPSDTVYRNIYFTNYPLINIQYGQGKKFKAIFDNIDKDRVIETDADLKYLDMITNLLKDVKCNALRICPKPGTDTSCVSAKDMPVGKCVNVCGTAEDPGIESGAGLDVEGFLGNRPRHTEGFVTPRPMEWFNPRFTQGTRGNQQPVIEEFKVKEEEQENVINVSCNQLKLWIDLIRDNKYCVVVKEIADLKRKCASLAPVDVMAEEGEDDEAISDMINNPELKLTLCEVYDKLMLALANLNRLELQRKKCPTSDDIQGKYMRAKQEYDRLNQLYKRAKLNDSKGLPKYMGCYTDTGAINEHHVKSPGMTRNKCTKICKQKGFKYSATQGGVNCYCGNGEAGLGIKEPEMTCNTRCAGDKNAICGGPNSNNVVQIGGVGVKHNVGLMKHPRMMSVDEFRSNIMRRPNMNDLVMKKIMLINEINVKVGLITEYKQHMNSNPALFGDIEKLYNQVNEMEKQKLLLEFIENIHANVLKNSPHLASDKNFELDCINVFNKIKAE